MDTPNVPSPIGATSQDSQQRTRRQRMRRTKSVGLKYDQLASRFLDTFPLGKQLSTARFDAWAEAEGLYKVQPAPAPNEKMTVERLAMLQERHIWRNRLHTASIHPRRNESPGGPFAVEHVKGTKDMLEVRAPYLAIAQNETPRLAFSSIVSKETYIVRLIESQDWSQLPETQRTMGMILLNGIQSYISRAEFENRMLEGQFEQYRRSLADGVKSGQIQPVNSALKALTEGIYALQHEAPPSPPKDEVLC